MLNSKFKFAVFLLFLQACCFAADSLSFSILGDSYSTFEGHVFPDTNECWYRPEERFEFAAKNDVREPEQMWWYLLSKNKGWKLEVNNSYSGATIGYLGYDNKDFSDRSFITRAPYLGNPELILVFGATNDSWIKGPIGKFKYKDWTRKDLFTFRPAMSLLADTLKKTYPDAKICFVINTKLNPKIVSSMHTICNHYGLTCLDLQPFEKQAGHPSVKGMEEIANQISEWYDSLQK